MTVFKGKSDWGGEQEGEQEVGNVKSQEGAYWQVLGRCIAEDQPSPSV